VSKLRASALGRAYCTADFNGLFELLEFGERWSRLKISLTGIGSGGLAGLLDGNVFVSEAMT